MDSAYVEFYNGIPTDTNVGIVDKCTPCPFNPFRNEDEAEYDSTDGEPTGQEN